MFSNVVVKSVSSCGVYLVPCSAVGHFCVKVFSDNGYVLL